MNESQKNRAELPDEVFDVLNQPCPALERLPQQQYFELPRDAAHVADALSWALRAPSFSADACDPSLEIFDATVLFERATVAWAKSDWKTRAFEPLCVHRDAARDHFLIGSPLTDELVQDCTAFFHPGAPEVTWEVGVDLCRFDISFHGFPVEAYVEGKPFDGRIDPEARRLLSIAAPCPTKVSSER